MPAIVQFPAAVKEICKHCGATRNPDYESTCFTCGELCCVGCAWCRCDNLAEHFAELYAMHREAQPGRINHSPGG
jgi:hypothetical protein